MDNLGDMDKLLKTYSLPKLNQEEAVSLNRLITRKIEAIIKKLPVLKALDGMATQVILPNIQRTNTYISQTIPKSPRRRKTPKLFL